MKDDVERLFHDLTPRGAPPELRERVLKAVAQELSNDIVSPWERWTGGLVAAAVLLGVVLNVWVVKTSEHRLADLAGPHLPPKSVAEMVAIAQSVAGSHTAEWLQQQLSIAWSARPAPPAQGLPEFERLINDLGITGKAHLREKAQEVPEKRTDRTGRAHRDSFDHQRDRHFRSQQTA
jgi:hypothetical protein